MKFILFVWVFVHIIYTVVGLLNRNFLTTYFVYRSTVWHTSIPQQCHFTTSFLLRFTLSSNDVIVYAF